MRNSLCILRIVVILLLRLAACVLCSAWCIKKFYFDRKKTETPVERSKTDEKVGKTNSEDVTL